MPGLRAASPALMSTIHMPIATALSEATTFSPTLPSIYCASHSCRTDGISPPPHKTFTNLLRLFPTNLARNKFRIIFKRACRRWQPRVSEDSINQISEAIKCEHWEDTQLELMTSIAQGLNPGMVMEVLRRERDAQNGARFFLWMDKQNGYQHTSDVYGVIIDILGEAKMFGEIESFLEQMSSTGCEVTVHILNGLIRSYGLDSRVKKALFFFDMIKDRGHVPPVSSYNSMLECLLYTRKFNTAENLFTEMLGNGVRPNKKTYTFIIQCMCKKGKMDDAVRLLKEMMESRFRPDVVNYTMVISGLCTRGRMEQAFEIFESMQMKGCEPNILTYNSMIIGLCIVGKVEEAVEWLGLMKNKGCEPNVYTYTVLLDNLCKLGRLGEAKGIFNQALKSGISPTVVTYNAMINGYCNLGELDEAIHLFDDMVRQDIIPDKYTCSSIIHAFLKRSKTLEAVRMHGEMEDKGYNVDIRTSTVLFCTLCRKGNTKDATRVFRILQEKHLRSIALHYHVLIRAHSVVGEMERAHAFLSEMIGNGITPKLVTCNTIIKGFCRQERLDAAAKILELMIENDIDPNDTTYSTLIKEYCKIGRLEDAQKIYQVALTKGVVPNKKPEFDSKVPSKTPELNVGDSLGLPEMIC